MPSESLRMPRKPKRHPECTCAPGSTSGIAISAPFTSQFGAPIAFHPRFLSLTMRWFCEVM